MRKFFFLALFTAITTYGQMPASHKSRSDADEIAFALQAGPKFVTLTPEDDSATPHSQRNGRTR
jgi:hypothetical protein